MLDQPLLRMLYPLVSWLPLGGTLLAVLRIGSAILLADGSATDVLAGNSGWVGTGILGAVLSWFMMIHLPAKDKQMMDMFREMRSLAKDVQDHCDKEIERILTIKLGGDERDKRCAA